MSPGNAPLSDDKFSGSGAELGYICALGDSRMKKLSFVVSLMLAENDYQNEQAAAAREAARKFGADIEVLYAGNDAVVQGQQLLKFIQSADRRPDGIVCHPVGTPLAHVAREAVAAGIAWAIVNREADYISELRHNAPAPVFSVTVDQHEIGRIQGMQLGALLPDGGLALYIVGPTSNPALKMRTAGMESAKPANVQLRTLPARLTEQSGFDVVTNWLELTTSHTSPVKLVAAQNDNMAMGARRAFSEKMTGSERERWGQLPYIGCDACPQSGQKWVLQGLLTASIILPPSAGLALELMAKAIQSPQTLPGRTLLAPVPFPPTEKLAAVASRD
jgi:ribose transport system substrate-binding protein